MKDKVQSVMFYTDQDYPNVINYSICVITKPPVQFITSQNPIMDYNLSFNFNVS